MNDLFEILIHRIDFSYVATSVGAVATILGLLASALGTRPRREIHRAENTPVEKASVDNGVAERLEEARQALKRQVALAKAHRVGGGMLTFGQFIVGGLLASSFLQEQTSKTLIGILGLLVLASSIIRQHYQPESSSLAAHERAIELKAVIREVEDQIYFRASGVGDAAEPHALRRVLTAALNDFDTAEAQAHAIGMQTSDPRKRHSTENSK
jgi:nanoRNase/pAp phosphatase (c-di-AMP/oligoRNAs hydrolase)